MKRILYDKNGSTINVIVAVNTKFILTLLRLNESVNSLYQFVIYIDTCLVYLFYEVTYT